ncbi:MAG: tRNA uridine-5-carboxymethylaminomethyl(34) synthesis GTPase MnmE [Pseudomonadota bacterium]
MLSLFKDGRPMETSDTTTASIAALSSGQGPGGIAVIRVSGADSHKIVRPLLHFKKKPASFQPEANVLTLCELLNLNDGTVIDEPLVVFFKAPHSFTGENSLEIHLHGGSWIVRKTLSLLFEAGCRPAKPGEFTLRAFEHGKIDLTKAEGIKALVEASSEQEWLAARQLASGKLFHLIDDVRKTLMNAMAWLEATIDFPDEGETSAVSDKEIEERVRLAEASIDRLLASASSGRIARNGLKVAILGQPNVGKSTLMNALLQENRAIVTAIPGTTRDYLEEKCLINGRLIQLVDTAGLREEGDEVEKIGMERSLEISKKADLILGLTARNQGEAGRSWLSNLASSYQETDVLFVETKSDLLSSDTPPGYLSISASTGKGMEDLKSKISEIVDAALMKVKGNAFVTEPRHIHALGLAKNALSEFWAVKARSGGEEMQAFELLEAARALTSIIGHIDSDDVLGLIFSTFCVGK